MQTGGVPINLALSSGNGSEVKDWSNGELKSETVAGASNINITLSNNITVASTVEDANLPTMSGTSSTTKYFFDFTDTRFADKTITIDGGNHTIFMHNAGLFFLNLKNCKVILRNITIDGGWKGLDADGNDVVGGISRGSSFINVGNPDESKSSEIEVGKGTTIKNCKNSGAIDGVGGGGGGALFNESRGAVIINGGRITSCRSTIGGAIFQGTDGSITITGKGIISNCSATADGGGIYNGGNTPIIVDSGSISDCSATNGGGIKVGGGGSITITGKGIISNCSATANGGGMDINGGEVVTVDGGGSISDCSAAVNGGGICIGGGGSITITGKGIIGNCSAAVNGGGIYAGGGTEITVDGGSISGCSAASGRGIFSLFGTVKIPNVVDVNDTVKYVASGGHMILDKKSKMTNYSGVNLPIGGLRKVHEPKKVIFDFCGQTIHHNDPNVPFIQGVPGKHIVICNLKMDGGGCK